MAFRALLIDSRSARFYDYWQALRRDRPMPTRQDLDPADIKDLLPHVVIVQIVGDRFLFRLVGTEVVRRIGSENTGRFFDELGPLGGYREFMTRVYETVRDRKRAVLSETDYGEGMEGTIIRRLSLPFSDDGINVSHVVTLLFCYEPKGAERLTVSDDDQVPTQHRIVGVDDDS